MTCEATSQKDDWGTILEITIMECIDGELRAVDLSSFTTLQLIFRDPEYTLSTKIPVLKTDGTDGVIQYTYLEGEFNLQDNWSYQFRGVSPLGAWRSEIATLPFGENLE
jgi:hypothetical protein